MGETRKENHPLIPAQPSVMTLSSEKKKKGPGDAVGNDEGKAYCIWKCATQKALRYGRHLPGGKRTWSIKVGADQFTYR